MNADQSQVSCKRGADVGQLFEQRAIGGTASLDEVTVKRFKRTRSSIELIPENPDFKTIVVPFGDTEFEIEGLAVGLIRNNMLM